RHVTLRELPAERGLAAFGLAPMDYQIASVEPLTPARAAGIRPGDIPLAIDGAPVRGAADPIERIRRSGRRKLTLRRVRAGEMLAGAPAPARQPVPAGDRVETHYTIGVGLSAPQVGGELRVRVRSNPFAALAFGAHYTTELVGSTARAFSELFRGRVGLG